MQNYNQTLQTNNSSLEEIITQLNNMPDAGGGSAAPILQDKTVTPSTSQQTVTADSGYDGLDTVTVNAMPTATQATPSVSIDANGKIIASATQSAGYVSAGTKTGTKQMTTQAAKTITPSTSSQTAVAKNVYTTGVVTVAAIPSNYEDVSAETTEYTSLNSELEEVINSLPDAGGSSGGGNVEYEIVNLTENTTSISFTLKRLTATYGISTNHQSVCGVRNLAHQNTSAISAYYAGKLHSFVRELSLSNASLSSGTEFFAPYTAVFINDPSQEAIYQENN